MGYKVNSGLAWGEGYLVMDANTFQNTSTNVKCHIYYVKDVTALDNCTFPVKDGTWKPKVPSLDEVPEGQILEDEDGITSETAPEENESSSSDENSDDDDVGEDLEVEASPDKEDSESPNYDRWERQCYCLARVHNVPRNTRYCPSVDKDAVPFGWTLGNPDVRRTTITNSKDNADGKRGYDMDYWRGLKELYEIPHYNGWQGVTLFRFVKPDPPPGYYWCDGTRLTKIDKIQRCCETKGLHARRLAGKGRPKTTRNSGNSCEI